MQIVCTPTRPGRALGDRSATLWTSWSVAVTQHRSVHAHYGKRVSDWNWLIRLRRQIGLFSFFLACTHLAVYLAFDVELDIGSILDDALQRPFIFVGMAAFALLLPLAARSIPGRHDPAAVAAVA